jgi:DNA-binding MarR family transcriptional regulator
MELQTQSDTPNAPLAILIAEVRSLGNWLKQAQFNGDHASFSAAAGILQLLAEDGPQTVPQLARARTTSRQNIQVLVNRLETQGWVTTRPNPAHQRSPLVCVTERAQQLIAGMNREQTTLESILAKVPASEMRVAVSVLRKIQDSFAGTHKVEAASTRQPLVRRTLRKSKVSAEETSPAPGEDNFASEEEFPVNLL